MLPLYLLDGQQRLTSLHRLLTDHPEAQVVFNVEAETFQNQSAATKRDPRWVKVYDLIRPDADLFEIEGRIRELDLGVDRRALGRRLSRVAAIPQYKYHMEIVADLPYEEVTQIFVRVNSGGRSLKTTDLALATLSARWPGVLAKVEEESSYWAKRGFGDLDVTFLTRALTGAVLGRGLSAWSHARLAGATDEELEAGWATVQRGLRHLVPLLRNNLAVSTSRILPSINVILPLVVLLGERPDEALSPDDANGVLYWFLAATLRNRYSSSADTLLGQDIPAARSAEPVATLLSELGLQRARLTVTSDALAGRGAGSPYFFLSFLTARRKEAHDWWYWTAISSDAEGGQKLEYHHIHPRATLKSSYGKAVINDIANLAFISGRANRRISDRSPSDYFKDLSDEELMAHFVPLDEDLREAGHYEEFLARRREILAEEITKFLENFRPAWLDAKDDAPGASDESVDLVLVGDRLSVIVDIGNEPWMGSCSREELEAALREADEGLESELTAAGEVVTVSAQDDVIEAPVGPVTLYGPLAEWLEVLDRERYQEKDARPILPQESESLWEGTRSLVSVRSTR